MCERAVPAGEILIQEGEIGAAASELYVVKSGKFEVRPRPRVRAATCLRQHASHPLQLTGWGLPPLGPASHAPAPHPAAGRSSPGPGAPQERQHARQHEGAGRRFRGGVAAVQLPADGHCGRNHRRRGVGAGALCIQVRASTFAVPQMLASSGQPWG